MKWKKLNFSEEEYHYWIMEDKLKTEFDFDEISVILISSVSKNITQFDHTFIENTILNIDKHFHNGIEHIKSELRKNPDLFKLNDAELEHIKTLASNNNYIDIPDNNVEQYINTPSYEFPVNQPNIVFYSDCTWMLQFTEANFPTVNYGHGIAITFDKSGTIIDFEILQESQHTDE